MAKTTEKTVVDIADFFTTSREKEGSWYEAKAKGIPTGLEFKILGKTSDPVVKAMDKLDKETEKIQQEKDPIKRAELDRKVACDSISSFIVDLRAAEGMSVIIDGKPISYSQEVVYKILYESPDIRADIFKAVLDESNFMKKKL